MPGSSCIARIIGCTGTEGRSGTIARNSCSTLLASEISATTNRAMRASSVIVSSVLRLLGEAAEDQHHLGSNGVDRVTNLLVIQHEVDELRDLNVIDRDRGLIVTRDDQVLLLGILQFKTPRGYAVNVRAGEVSARKVRVHQGGSLEARPAEVRLREAHVQDVRPAEESISEVRAGKVRFAEVRPPDVRLAEVRPPEVRPDEVCPAQVRPSEVRLAEPRLPQFRPPEVRPAEVRVAQLRLADVRLAAVHPPEIRPPEVRPAEVRLAQVWIDVGVLVTP